MNKKLPLYKAILSSVECGISKISLVSLPAVQSNFVCFSEEKQEVKFAVQDEEKREILGVIMRADFPIYRNSNGYEYYVQYDADVIKEMAQKMFEDGNENKINLQHQDNTDVQTVKIFECFIKDTENGINPKGFEDIENGSIFARFKVEDDNLWKEIKDGTFKGFSLEGTFEFVEEKDDDIDEIIDLLNKILN